MKYRWLLFDADGTLFDYDRAEASALRTAFADMGIAYEPGYAEAYQKVNSRLWRQFENGQVSQIELRTRRFRELVELCRLDADPVEFSRTYLHRLGQGIDLIDGAEKLLAALDGRFGLAIITNGLKDVQRSRFALSPIGRYFSPIVISEEVGSAKPDGRIFDAAFTQMGNPSRRDVLIIGDSLSSDMTGGSRYGIDTCWFNPGQQPLPDSIEVTFEIKQLSELLALI